MRKWGKFQGVWNFLRHCNSVQPVLWHGHPFQREQTDPWPSLTTLAIVKWRNSNRQIVSHSIAHSAFSSCRRVYCQPICKQQSQIGFWCNLHLPVWVPLCRKLQEAERVKFRYTKKCWFKVYPQTKYFFLCLAFLFFLFLLAVHLGRLVLDAQQKVRGNLSKVTGKIETFVKISLSLSSNLLKIKIDVITQRAKKKVWFSLLWGWNVYMVLYIKLSFYFSVSASSKNQLNEDFFETIMITIMEHNQTI